MTWGVTIDTNKKALMALKSAQKHPLFKKVAPVSVLVGAVAVSTLMAMRNQTK